MKEGQRGMSREKKKVKRIGTGKRKGEREKGMQACRHAGMQAGRQVGM